MNNSKTYISGKRYKIYIYRDHPKDLTEKDFDRIYQAYSSIIEEQDISSEADDQNEDSAYISIKRLTQNAALYLTP